ncbi:hypothetical protein FSP39_013861 [Pinctada imbricata]|uniref:THD domain-containing protein n=1 Tax=Pinctada imbricata TaxID=66713 RepID=A0AA89BTM1_PINIB|nr:hypothetical protein FSP39_013861 [Pinctada imbricata]
MPSSLQQLRHTVLRQRGSAPTADMVLQDSLSTCKLQTGTSNSSSFVGAAFRLEKGDEIMVEVSDYTLVAKSEISNYFGLHMI